MQHMKTMQKCLILLLAGAMAAISCNKQQEVKTYTISSDITSISEIPANNPGSQTLVVTTDAPYWIAQGPDWVTIDPVTGVGGGKSTVVTLSFQSNYKNESTDMAPRTGEVKFSGGMTSLVVPVSQLGHKGYIDPNASIGGIPDEDEFLDFIAAVNDGDPVVRWLNDKQEVQLLADLDLSEVAEWVPIGNVEKTGNGNNASAPEGNYFTGVFDGGGHTIKGFKASKTDIEDGGTYGFFGALYRATVKNLNLEADFTVGGLSTGDAGVLAGTVYASTIENVKIKATIKTEGTQTDNKRFAVGGLAGFVFCCSSEGDLLESSIKNCEVEVTVTGGSGKNTKSGATAEAIASQRPNIPMLSVTSNPRVAGQLALAYANSAIVRPYDVDYALNAALDLKGTGYLKVPEGKDSLTVVLVSGLRDEEGGTNQIQIRKI